MNTVTGAAAIIQRITSVINQQRAELQSGWLNRLTGEGQIGIIDRLTLEDLCSRLLDQFLLALSDGLPAEKRSLPAGLRDLLSAISTDFVERGLSPSQTALYIFSLKRELHPLLADSTVALLTVNELIDAMGLYSMDAFIVRREQIIRRQTQELLDISVPVVPLWEGILSLPIIGTLDSGRAQAITERLLLEIARTSSRYAVLDISGVPTVDTQTAQYLAKTVAAARLMGAECLITGIRPAIAQVMVTLGINMASIETRFSLADGLRSCFAKLGLTVRRA